MSNFVHEPFSIHTDLPANKFLKVELLVKGNMHLFFIEILQTVFPVQIVSICPPISSGRSMPEAQLTNTVL